VYPVVLLGKESGQGLWSDDEVSDGLTLNTLE